LVESIDITSNAVISSETFIVPISAAMAEPTIADRMIAVMKGPISRHIVIAASVPIWSPAPNFLSSMPLCRERIIPAKNATIRVTGSARTPTAYAMSSVNRRRLGR